MAREPESAPPVPPRRAIRRLNFIGVFVLVLMGAGAVWATTAELSGAVIAGGSVEVESNVKEVQHPTGGIVSELMVREGARVEAGDVLVRLDATEARASSQIVGKQLVEGEARYARTLAERDDLDAIAFPASLTGRADDPEVANIMAGEVRLFEIRRAARLGQQSQLRERIGQVEQEVEGYRAQLVAVERELELVENDLERNRPLYERGVLPSSQQVQLERQAAQLQGERGRLLATIARTAGQISEIELQILQVDQNMRGEVGTQLRDIEAEIAGLRERLVAAEDRLRRTEIRAPQTGFVHELAVHTIDGVIAAGAPIMKIIPEADVLTVEARVAPTEIDQLTIGQLATLRFSAFNRQTTPEIRGRLARIGADVTVEPQTGLTFYEVRIDIPPEELAHLGNLQILPGMMVEVFIETDRRTILSYLMKPLVDQIEHTFRER